MGGQAPKKDKCDDGGCIFSEHICAIPGPQRFPFPVRGTSPNIVDQSKGQKHRKQDQAAVRYGTDLSTE